MQIPVKQSAVIRSWLQQQSNAMTEMKLVGTGVQCYVSQKQDGSALEEVCTQRILVLSFVVQGYLLLTNNVMMEIREVVMGVHLPVRQKLVGVAQQALYHPQQLGMFALIVYLIVLHVLAPRLEVAHFVIRDTIQIQPCKLMHAQINALPADTQMSQHNYVISAKKIVSNALIH